jgi:hypothetical protein
MHLYQRTFWQRLRGMRSETITRYTMFIAQAQMESMILVTADSMFKEYQDTTIFWAGNKG